MGYHTDFSGEFYLDTPLTEAQKNYLHQFSRTRRMKRDADKTALRPDPVREAVGLPVGIDGGYFVGETGYAGQDHGPDVVDDNYEPSGQPSLWCQWIPSDDGSTIEWDGGGKFYSYVKWIRYIIEHFLKPWGHNLNGEVKWFGEEHDDMGIIIVKNNVVTTKRAKVTFEYDEEES